jgi:hypothetical protein
MAMKRKSDELEVGTKSASERQLRAAAKVAVKKADRFWRLAQKASSESYREHRVKQARAASEIAADKTRQADQLRAKAHEERNRAET